LHGILLGTHLLRVTRYTRSGLIRAGEGTQISERHLATLRGTNAHGISAVTRAAAASLTQEANEFVES
jgi:hypothetical protein